MKRSNLILFVVPDEQCGVLVRQDIAGLKVMVVSAKEAEQSFNWACGMQFAQVNIMTYINPQSAKYLMSRIRHSPYIVSIHNGDDIPEGNYYEDSVTWIESKLEKFD
ncbi:hypothetical protein D3C85_869390 [compost metagenome]